MGLSKPELVRNACFYIELVSVTYALWDKFVIDFDKDFVWPKPEPLKMAKNYTFFLETAIRGYHAYLPSHKLTLEEILSVEPDAHAISHDVYAMKFLADEEIFICPLF